MRKLLIILFTFCLLISQTFAFICPADSIDEFHRDPNFCDIFYRCYNGKQLSFFQCSPGTAFDLRTNNCNWAHAVDCSTAGASAPLKPVVLALDFAGSGLHKPDNRKYTPSSSSNINSYVPKRSGESVGVVVSLQTNSGYPNNQQKHAKSSQPCVDLSHYGLGLNPNLEPCIPIKTPYSQNYDGYNPYNTEVRNTNQKKTPVQNPYYQPSQSAGNYPSKPHDSYGSYKPSSSTQKPGYAKPKESSGTYYKKPDQPKDNRYYQPQPSVNTPSSSSKQNEYDPYKSYPAKQPGSRGNQQERQPSYSKPYYPYENFDDTSVKQPKSQQRVPQYNTGSKSNYPLENVEGSKDTFSKSGDKGVKTPAADNSYQRKPEKNQNPYYDTNYRSKFDNNNPNSKQWTPKSYNPTRNYDTYNPPSESGVKQPQNIYQPRSSVNEPDYNPSGKNTYFPKNRQSFNDSHRNPTDYQRKVPNYEMPFEYHQPQRNRDDFGQRIPKPSSPQPGINDPYRKTENQNPDFSKPSYSNLRPPEVVQEKIDDGFSPNWKGVLSNKNPENRKLESSVVYANEDDQFSKYNTKDIQRLPGWNPDDSQRRDNREELDDAYRNSNPRRPTEKMKQDQEKTNPSRKWSKMNADATPKPIAERHDSEPDDLKADENYNPLKKILNNDPFAVKNLMDYLNCEETHLTNCSECPNINRIKFPNIFLQSPIVETVKVAPEYIKKACFAQCQNIRCVAFSYNEREGTCFIFKSQVSPQAVYVNENYTTVIIPPETMILADEWLYTKPAAVINNQMAQLNTENYIGCLHECMKQLHCKAITFAEDQKICKLYDPINGKHIGLAIDSVAIQHRSLFESSERWRFSDFGKKRLNATIPIASFPIDENEECLQECLKTRGCLLISIEGNEVKECHIYNRISTSANDDNFQSYLLQVPINSSSFLELPRIYFTGKPLAKYSEISLEQCQDIARETATIKKLSYLTQQKECFLFPDSAIIGNWNDQEIEVRTFLLNLPNDENYLNYKRIPGIILFNPNLRSSVRINQVNALDCIKICEQRNCSGIGVTYDTVKGNIDCILYNEDELKFSSLIYKNNSELFLRTNLMKSVKHLDEICLDPENKEKDMAQDANENLDYFQESFDKPSNDLSANLMSPPRLVKKHVGPLPANGDDYVGLPDNLESFDENLNDISAERRSRRSIYTMIVHSAKIYKSLIEEKNSDKREAEQVAGKAAESIMNSVISEMKNNKNDTSFLTQFIHSVEERLTKPKKEMDYKKKIVSSVRRARRSANETARVSCLVTRGNTFNRRVTCLRNEICSKVPKIKFVNEEQIAQCENVRINSSCPVICKSGYKPTRDRIICEKNGNKGEWNIDTVTCEPDKEECENLPWIPVTFEFGLDKLKMLHYLVKFDKNRKLPIFSLHKYEVENFINPAVNQTFSHRHIPHPCPQLKGYQLSHVNYKFSNYERGHLTSPLALSYSKEASEVANYIVNTAPQDPFSKQVPWSILDERLNNYLSKNPGIVVSGVCMRNIYLPLNPSLPVPKCFWRIVCTKTLSGDVTAAAFYHDNSHPLTVYEKKRRIEEVMSYTNPVFVQTLIGKEHYDSIWSESPKYFTNNQSKSFANDDFIEKCSEGKISKQTDVNFWNELLLNSSYGQKWPTDFENALESEATSNENSNSRGRSLSFTVKNDEPVDSTCDRKVIAYLVPSEDSKFRDDIDQADSITHLIYGFLNVNSNGSLDYSMGDNMSKRYSHLYKLLQLKKKKPDIKLIIGIGGWEGSDHLSSVANKPNLQNTLVKETIAFLTYWNFDGVHFAWQYPVVGGKVKGNQIDKENYIKLLKKLRIQLNQEEKNSGKKYSLSIAAPGAFWILERGYKLDQVIQLVDWVNVLAFDYYGPWKSNWGSYTGPIAPLYFGAPDGYPGKLNVYSTIKEYVCKINNASNKIILTVPFFAKLWRNVGGKVEGSDDDLYRKAAPISGAIVGDTLTQDELNGEKEGQEEQYHNKTETSYLFNKMKRTLISYENDKSIMAKINFVGEQNLGGIGVWSLDHDDSSLSLMKFIDTINLCNKQIDKKNKTIVCSTMKEKLWWTQFDGEKDRMCGKMAPLISGKYPICDPSDVGYSCCGEKGFCGSGTEYCECPNCVDFSKLTTDEIMKEAISPSQKVKWHTLESNLNSTTPNCGLNSPLLADKSVPICNPDSKTAHCCSSDGFCGTGDKFCSCSDCHDFRKEPNFIYKGKLYWDWSDGIEKAGRCGYNAPKIYNEYPICNERSLDAHCCSENGFCGSGPKFCQCSKCIDFRKFPSFRF